MDIFKHLAPSQYVPWIIGAIALIWIGWTASGIYAMVEKHYTETTGLTFITLETCKAVHVMAKLNPKNCSGEGR